MCKYSENTGYKCPHEKLEDSDYCIFHLKNNNKNVDEFNKMIKEVLEKEANFINFNGFYFPPGTTDFSNKNFQKSISFDWATFSGDTDFRNATFSGDAIFRYTTFSKTADFMNATFSGDAKFWDVEFSGDADFMEATFSGDTDFRNATFSGDADFRHATFSKTADFWGVKFSKTSNFSHVTFSEISEFGEGEFLGDAKFWDVEFSGDADFVDTKFSGDANFKLAKFSGYANFWDVKFSETSNFIDTIFLGDANFRDVEIAGKFDFVSNKSETIFFENTYFSDNVRLIADLSRCCFANSNIERVDMTDSIWIRDDDKPEKSFSTFYERIRNKVGLSETQIIIWEESQGELSSNWKKVEGIYRRLKQSYQKFGDISTAGKFYYQEMECKRKQLKGIEKHFWYFFYKMLCGYGEKPFNVIWASLFLIFVSAFLYLFGGIEFVGNNVLKVPPNVIDYNLNLNSFGLQWVMSNIDSVLKDFLLCVYTSVITFTTLGYGDVHPIGFSRIVASVEAGFGIIMTALFIFVFTRRMLR